VIPVTLTVLCRDGCAERARVLCGEEAVAIVGHLEPAGDGGNEGARIQLVVDELDEVLEIETPIAMAGEQCCP